MPGARGWSVSRKPQSLLIQAVRVLCALCPDREAQGSQSDGDRRRPVLPEEGIVGWHRKVTRGRGMFWLYFFLGGDWGLAHPWGQEEEKVIRKQLCMIRPLYVSDCGWQEAGWGGPCKNILRATGCQWGLFRGWSLERKSVANRLRNESLHYSLNSLRSMWSSLLIWLPQI